MISSVTDVFLTVKNRYKTPVKLTESLFRGGPWPLRPHSDCATACSQSVAFCAAYRSCFVLPSPVR